MLEDENRNCNCMQNNMSNMNANMNWSMQNSMNNMQNNVNVMSLIKQEQIC